MKFDELLAEVGELPLLRTGLLLAGERDPGDVRRQLSRWTAAGKLVQLRRNVYLLARPWRRVEPHPFLVANELHAPSYVSLQSALSYHGLIPEAVPVTTSVTTARPTTLDTPLGRFAYRHVHAGAFFGYVRIPVWAEQDALVASPAKALFDLVHLTPAGDSREYLASLRLDGLSEIPMDDLTAVAARWRKPKIARALDAILEQRERE